MIFKVLIEYAIMEDQHSGDLDRLGRRIDWTEYPEYTIDDEDHDSYGEYEVEQHRDDDDDDRDSPRRRNDRVKSRKDDDYVRKYIRSDPYYHRDNGERSDYRYAPIDRVGHTSTGPIDRADNRADYGGYGHEEKKECCPLVIKPLVLLALLGTLAAATAFLNVLITMNIGRRKRRRRSSPVGSSSSSALVNRIWLGMSSADQSQ